MKAFAIAAKLYLGTLLIHTAMLMIYGMVSIDIYIVTEAIVGLMMGVFIAVPLLVSAVALVWFSSRIPYSAISRMWWLGTMLLVQNSTYLYSFVSLESFLFKWKITQFFFYTTSFALVVMLFFTRNSIKKYYSQQTTSNKNL